jgi:hypothetical protein
VQPLHEPDEAAKAEIERRWKALREAKRSLMERGEGNTSARDHLTPAECDRALGDRKGGLSTYERKQREEQSMATTNGKHGTNGTAVAGKPLCPKCNKPVRVYAAGGTRCYYCDNPKHGRGTGDVKPAKPAPDHPWKDKKTPAAPAGQERRREADPPHHTAPHVQADEVAPSPVAGNPTETAARDLGALGRFALPEFVELEPAEEDLDVELRAFRALLGLTLAQRRRVLAFAEAVGVN